MRRYRGMGSTGLRTLLCAAVVGLTGCGDDDDGGTAPGPRGDFTIRTVTTGVEFDAVYGIAIDDIFTREIGPNDSTTFESVAVDTYLIELVEVADNCVVAPDNPRSLALIAESTVETTFEVECFETEGTLEVVTVTAGANPDQGYGLALDGADVGAIGANDTLRTTGLVTGDHTIELSGIAVNCVLAGDPTRTVAVPSEGTVTSTYEVFCTDRVGDLRIITESAGLEDPSGYDFVVQFEDPLTIGPNDAVTIASVAQGVARVELLAESVEPICTLVGEPVRMLEVREGEVTETVFAFDCQG